MDPTFEQEHLGIFAQMQILEILPNIGCRLRYKYMLSKTESFFIARLVKPLGDRNSEKCCIFAASN